MKKVKQKKVPAASGHRFGQNKYTTKKKSLWYRGIGLETNVKERKHLRHRGMGNKNKRLARGISSGDKPVQPRPKLTISGHVGDFVKVEISFRSHSCRRVLESQVDGVFPSIRARIAMGLASSTKPA